jgi:predicted phage terminase large subunit-like protein
MQPNDTALAAELSRICKAAQINPADPDAASRLRRLCQTDLRFLGETVLGIPYYEPVHGKFIELFVQKDPSKGIYEQDIGSAGFRQRLLLAPRNTLKTTWDGVDILQWIICFPDIRILILSGTQDLAIRMVTVIKRYLQANPVIRALFPLCPVEEDTRWGNVDEFTVVRNMDWREPTLCMSTIASVKASSHYDVFKIDDVCNELNCATPEQRNKVKSAVEDTSYLAEPQGSYFDFIGTRYDTDDYYGHLLAANEQAEQGIGSENREPLPTKVCCLSAWTIRKDRVIEMDESNVPILKIDDVDLLYPERWSFKELHKQYRKNPYKFSCQMQSKPDVSLESALVSFDDALIHNHCIPYDQLPFSGRTFVCFDPAGYSKANNTDYCAGVVGRLSDNGRLYILDIIRGRYNQVQMAAAIVTAAKDWQPEITIIEDSQGSKGIEPTIVQIAQEQHVSVPIHWYTYSRKKNSKSLRIGHVASVLRADRLWFAAHIRNSELQAMREEFVNFPFGRHDDIADAISILVAYLPQLSEGPAIALDHDSRQRRVQELRDKLFDRMLFGSEAEQWEEITSNESPDNLLGSSLMQRPA